MIEIRTYEGDFKEAVRLIQGVWRGQYEGKMPFPLWDEQYFEWQLASQPRNGSSYLIAAYDGPKLIGVFFAAPYRFHVCGAEIDGTMGSWFTVHPDYSSLGVGLQLISEMQRRHIDNNAVFCLGYALGGKASMGIKFWKIFFQAFPSSGGFLTKVGFWVRVFDHSTVAHWAISPTERFGLRLLRRLQPKCHAPADLEGIREYRSEDLTDCLKLTCDFSQKVDLGYIWNACLLERQLQFKTLPRTVVLEEKGKVTGYINYHRLDFFGRFPLAVAVIDFIIFGTMSYSTCKKLLGTVLAQMEKEGIKMAITLRLPIGLSRPLLAAGFIPTPAEHYLLCLKTEHASLPKDIQGFFVFMR